MLALRQLTQVRNLINSSLDVIDVTTWTGDAKNADFIAGQLRLLFDNVQEAKQTLKGSQEINKLWCEDPLDDNVKVPDLTAKPHCLHTNRSLTHHVLQILLYTGP